MQPRGLGSNSLCSWRIDFEHFPHHLGGGLCYRLVGCVRQRGASGGFPNCFKGLQRMPGIEIGNPLAHRENFKAIFCDRNRHCHSAPVLI